MALADPSNYGNPPGQGPLSAGGQPGSIKSDEADLPSTLSKAAKAQLPDLVLVRDLDAGPSRIKAMGQTYLPKAPREEYPNYNTRLERAHFFNAFSHTAKGLTGLVFRKDPVLGEDCPPEFVDHSENIDLEGTHIDVFLRDIFNDAMVAGHAAILVEAPEEGPKHSGENNIKRPYWIPIKKENILSWRTVKENGRLILTQIVLRETTMIPQGLFGEKEQVRYRVLYRDGVVGWKLLEINDRQQIIQVGEGIYGNQDEIPIAEIPTSGKRSMFESDPPLLDLAYTNLAHYRQWSDYDTSLHMSCVPLLWEAGATETRDAEGKVIPKVVGPNSMFSYPDPQAKLGYAEHAGAGQQACKQSLDDLKSDMGTIGVSMLASQKRTAETAEAKRIDKSGSDSQLSASARGLQDGTERAIGFHCNYLQKPAGSIEINRDFESTLMEAPVMSAYAQLVEAGFDKEIVVRMLQIGGRVPEDADPEELALSWDAAARAAQEVERLEKEEQAENMANEVKKAA